MAYEFKNLSDVDQLDQLSGSTTIMGFDNGKPVQFSTDKVGNVKTVNGSVPDENGNIELQTASSWNDLTDKPFDENNIIKPEALPEGCPYKEIELVEVLPEETIALVAMNDADNTIYTAMFSTIPHIVDGHTYAVYIDGQRFETTAFVDEDSAMVVITDNGTLIPDSWVIQVSEEHMSAGLVCLGMPSGSDTITIKIEEIVVVRSRKIDEDLLPDSVKGGGSGGGALVVKFDYTGGGPGQYSEVHVFDGITLDKTYDEIKAAVDAGIPVEIRDTDSSPEIVMRLFQNDMNGYMHFACLKCSFDPRAYSYDGKATVYCLCVKPDGPVGGYFTIK